MNCGFWAATLEHITKVFAEQTSADWLGRALHPSFVAKAIHQSRGLDRMNAWQTMPTATRGLSVFQLIIGTACYTPRSAQNTALLRAAYGGNMHESARGSSFCCSRGSPPKRAKSRTSAGTIVALCTYAAWWSLARC